MTGKYQRALRVIKTLRDERNHRGTNATAT
ncbi:unnamed protein product, partial [Rotaria sp. Silwood2]